VNADTYDARYLAGIRWFNRGEFFQAHEVWEEVWKERHGPSHDFFKGLIQTAVCLHHFRNRNTRGARKLFHSSRRYLLPYCPRHEGLDVDRLLRDMQICCQAIADSEETFPQARLDAQLLPKIELPEESDLPDGHAKNG
jgi:predicted metal-dependent hydrolase